MKNSNDTGKVIEARYLAEDLFSHAGIDHNKSYFKIKIRQLAFLVITVVAIVSLTSCFGIYRGEHGERHEHHERHEHDEHHDRDEHHDNDEHRDLNYIQPLNNGLLTVSTSFQVPS